MATRRSSGKVAVGVADHAGWAILTTVARDGTVLDRRRVELVDPELPKLPHHHDAQGLPVDVAVALIERVQASADSTRRPASARWHDVRTVLATAATTMPRIEDVIREAGAALGPPWQNDHGSRWPPRSPRVVRPMQRSVREEAVMNETKNREIQDGGLALHGVRYQVKDVARSVAFYTEQLGFTCQHQQLPAFAAVSLGELTLLLSGPGASGSRPMPGGGTQEPGGWNRIVLRATDLPRQIGALKERGVKCRNEMETGPAGRQIQIEDPDGNPIELFEPAR